MIKMSYVEDEYQEITCPHCKKKVVLLLQFDFDGNLKWCDIDEQNIKKYAPKFEYKTAQERKIATAITLFPEIALKDISKLRSKKSQSSKAKSD